MPLRQHELALLGVATIAAALGAAPAKHAAPKASPPPKVVRAIVVSGNGQSARAFVAPSSLQYQADFPDLLVVRVQPRPQPGEERHVKFRCITDSCAFAAAEQPDVKNLEHPLPQVYDVKVDQDGNAVVRVSLLTRTVAGAFTIRAEPVPADGSNERTTNAEMTLKTY